MSRDRAGIDDGWAVADRIHRVDKSRASSVDLPVWFPSSASAPNVLSE